MKKIFLFIFTFTFFYSFGQTNPSKNSGKYSDPQNMDVVYSSEAKCKLGEEALYNTIYEKMSYSDEAKSANINDKVLLSFDVNFDNKLQNFNVIHGVGYGIDEALIKIISEIPFEAAVMNGIKVRQNVILSIPIRTYPEM